jgi:hypothetical protein
VAPEVFKQPDDLFAVGRSFVEVALDLAGRMAQARAHRTRTQLERARVLRICGDSRRARKLQQSAPVSARELGMAAPQV